jgi:hypothetical protein
MNLKTLSAVSLGTILLLSGCSGDASLSAADQAKEEKIARLKASLCVVPNATGRDGVNGQDMIDVWNNGEEPIPNDPSQANFWEKYNQWSRDLDTLLALVPKWLDDDGQGWIKFCSSK